MTSTLPISMLSSSAAKLESSSTPANAHVNDESSVSHPVQLIQSQAAANEQTTKKTMLARVYGVHLPMKLEMEQRILAQFQRHPALKSSMVGLETALGVDTEIGFEDVLDDPEFADKVDDPVVAMEKKLAMQLAAKKNNN
eukprot:TRINITY_DN87090_c0_g1_i1.p2 TRINITY_DN87090_c0_g1~~TRINITY_DN87090_c0_g1_i1.p2  ORF type:complete len:149 (+),score=84.76 TRINITY_DN87090_c0_g1_i1:29-448(+)